MATAMPYPITYEVAPELKELGVAEVFTPGTTTGSIVQWVSEHVRPADAA